jgi:hypothetical protein
VNWLPAVLFLPWFAILGTLFWLFPRQPRAPARRAYDVGALLVSVLAFALALRWAHAYADRAYGNMWPQIFATSVGYGAFLAVLAFAFLLRARWLRRE